MFEFIVCLTILNASGSWRAMTLTIISAHIRARLIAPLQLQYYLGCLRSRFADVELAFDRFLDLNTLQVVVHRRGILIRLNRVY